jgi:hypothetical protein
MAPVTARGRRWLWAGLVVALAAGAALYWFAPWNLAVDRRVDEALPTASIPPEQTTGGAEGATSPDDGAAAGRATLSNGRFRSLEHETSGAALVIELGDGSRFVRLEDLETSNGPDLRVILSSEAPQDDWHVYDDGEVHDLGALKGNLGSSNYAIAPDVELSRFSSVVVWCRRFSVGFGVAPLDVVRA